MARYNWISPGAAASESILETLTQRRAEERQRLLDEIAAKDAESMRAAREAQIRQGVVQMRGTEENILASQEGRERARFTPAIEQMGVGDKPSTPEMRSWMEKQGLLVPASIKETTVSPVPFQAPQVGE